VALIEFTTRLICHGNATFSNNFFICLPEPDEVDLGSQKFTSSRT